jgi:nucleoside-diphosphate-sugar epimerase
VLHRLIAAGAHVRVLGPTPLKRQDVRHLIEQAEVRYLPLALESDGPVLADALKGCDSLVHLRYRRPLSDRFWPQVAEGVNDNLRETIRLMEAVEVAGIVQVCLASSVRVYTPPALGADENAPVGGSATPYAMVKLHQEDCVRRWAGRTGRSAAVLRLATVYGPGETVDRAIPNFIRAVLAGGRPVVDGRGASLFDPIYVADVAEAFVCALEKRAGGTFNIGTGKGWPPRHVARLVIRLCGAPGDVALDLAAADRGGPVCDVARAEAVLGFRPTTGLETGLMAEIEWLRELQLRRSA